MPPNTVYVGRPSRWGNPWTPKNLTVTRIQGSEVVDSRPGTVAECVVAYARDVKSGEFGYSHSDVRRELAGKNLACWCPLDQPCHADVLLDIANGGGRDH